MSVYIMPGKTAGGTPERK